MEPTHGPTKENSGDLKKIQNSKNILTKSKLVRCTYETSQKWNLLMNRPTLTKKIYHALIKDLPEEANGQGHLLLAARLAKAILPQKREPKKSEYEEVYIPFDQRPLYAQISDGDDWTGICRGREYFGDDITDPVDGVTHNIKTHLDLQNFGLFLNQVTI